MQLKYITFTGIGTDIGPLKEIQQQWPLVEFGVLISRTQRNGRFYNPENLKYLKNSGLNLSCHLCGSLARAAVCNIWNPVEFETMGLIEIFNRCQLNVSKYEPHPDTKFLEVPTYLNEVIIQQIDANHLNYYNLIQNKSNISILLDASGGEGIDTSIVPYDGPIIGYAGGINSMNVESKLKTLLESDLDGNFWIDIESGVRTNDVFDFYKCIRILEICYNLLKKY